MRQTQRSLQSDQLDQPPPQQQLQQQNKQEQSSGQTSSNSQNFEKIFQEKELDIEIFKQNYSEVEEGDIYEVGDCKVSKYTNKEDKNEYAVKRLRTNGVHKQEDIIQYLNEIKKQIELCQDYPEQFVIIHFWSQSKQIQQPAHRYHFVYMIMELADCSLKDKLEDLQKVEYLEKEKLFIMKQCFKIILTLHERKIFHRDLKPAQFLVFEKYKIKLSDFGSYYIKPTAEDTTISQKGGFTYNYWAPEYKYMEKQVVKNKKKFQIDDFFSQFKTNKIENYEIVQLLWQQFDAYSLGLVLMQVFFLDKEIGEYMEQENFQQLIQKKLINYMKEDNSKRILGGGYLLLITYLLLEKNPRNRITLTQITDIESYENLEQFFKQQKQIWSKVSPYLQIFFINEDNMYNELNTDSGQNKELIDNLTYLVIIVLNIYQRIYR